MSRRFRLATVALLIVFPTSIPASPTAADGEAVAAGKRIVTPVLSARRLPELLGSNITDTKLHDAMSDQLDVAPDNSCIIVSHEGRTIIDVRGGQAMVPASTAKLITAKAAVDLLGGDTRLETLASATAAPVDGIVDGDLYLIGGGDPLLTTEGYRRTLEDPEQLVNDFTHMADRIAEAGVKEIRGDVVGDDSRYDPERWVSTWPERYQREGFVGPLSALMVNDGSTGFSENPDTAGPNRKAGDPPLLAAETLVTILEDKGIEVTGSAKTGKAPDGVQQIATLQSSTIDEIVSELLLNSDNTTAELLVREIGVRKTGVGSTTAGLAEITKYMAELGLPTEGLELNDGSGLDPENRVPCTLLDALLGLDDQDPQFHELLPVAGETGTLRKRMVKSPAQGRVRAKTGSLNEVNALAGSVDTKEGVHLDFVYIVNGPEPRGIGVLDNFAAALAVVPAGPSSEDLSPVTPG